MQAITAFFKQYLLVSGRISRLEYINSQILNFILMTALLSCFDKWGWADQGAGMVGLLFISVTLMVITAIKRIQDMGEPVLERLVYCLLPIVGLYYGSELIWRSGEREPNEHGPDPRVSRAFQTWWWVHRVFIGAITLYLAGWVYVIAAGK